MLDETLVSLLMAFVVVMTAALGGLIGAVALIVVERRADSLRPKTAPSAEECVLRAAQTDTTV